jgi:multiple sugar transport system ATP-binding protein
MAQVRLVNITKKFGTTTVIPELNLEIPDKEFVVLVGPSGCGKTTTLRMIAGLEEATSGTIKVGERDVTQLRPGLRNCAMVFQNYALYPHMSVRQNISYGMKVRKMPKAEIEQRVQAAARILGLEALLERRPKNLSGGQRQRVAIGRAIVREPEVFLFDEPLSNLDAKLRIEMRTEIKNLHQRLSATMVYVTHDQVEAMTLADRVVVMKDGHIAQMADPITLYEQPANTFVAGFIGSPSMNFLNVTIEAEQEALFLRLEDQSRLRVPEDRRARYAPYTGQRVTLGIRPEHVAQHHAGHPARTEIKTEVLEPLGPHTLLLGNIGESRFVAQVDAHVRVKPGEAFPLGFDMQHMHLFDADSGDVL